MIFLLIDIVFGVPDFFSLVLLSFSITFFAQTDRIYMLTCLYFLYIVIYFCLFFILLYYIVSVFLAMLIKLLYWSKCLKTYTYLMVKVKKIKIKVIYKRNLLSIAHLCILWIYQRMLSMYKLIFAYAPEKVNIFMKQ